MTDPKQAKAVLAHIKDTLKKNAPSDDQIRAAVAELILSNDEAKYMLSRLASRMQTNTKEVKIDEANLEHIFPKNPAKEWKDLETMEPLLWHVGNLTMLGERLNRDAGNKEFSVKRAHYAKNSELEMAQDVAKTYKTGTRTLSQTAPKGWPHSSSKYGISITHRGFEQHLTGDALTGISEMFGR